MSSQFIAFFSIFFIIYTGANYYVAWRFMQAFREVLGQYVWLYGSVYVCLALSPLVARIGKDYFPGYLNDILDVIGAYWLAAVYYFVLLWGLFDCLSLLVRLLAGERLAHFAAFAGMGFVVLVVVLFSYGTWNARHPRVVHYDLTIEKQVAGLASLHAVMVSDIHLGVLVGNDRLLSLVDRINGLKPDIVFLAGDTIDEDVRVFVERNMPDVLVRLSPKYGTYAVMGNHEYIGGSSKLAVQSLEQAGVKVLRDEYIKVNNQFYVVGRDDRAAPGFTGRPRQELAQLMEGIDLALPVILLDHQPFNLTEGQAGGVDLQLSGHTHHGQFFPNNLITEHIYEQDWGYIKKDAFQAIVSCGFGTWGPPIRIGNQPEIVDITIEFKTK